MAGLFESQPQPQGQPQSQSPQLDPARVKAFEDAIRQQLPQQPPAPKPSSQLGLSLSPMLAQASSQASERGQEMSAGKGNQKKLDARVDLPQPRSNEDIQRLQADAKAGDDAQRAYQQWAPTLPDTLVAAASTPQSRAYQQALKDLEASDRQSKKAQKVMDREAKKAMMRKQRGEKGPGQLVPAPNVEPVPTPMPINPAPAQPAPSSGLPAVRFPPNYSQEELAIIQDYFLRNPPR